MRETFWNLPMLWSRRTATRRVRSYWQGGSRGICGPVTASAHILVVALLSLRTVAADQRPPNVVLITIDTVRADHLGCYGDESIRTPNIDRLAREGARFAQAYTPVPITLPAHTALMTGKFPL